MFGPTRRDLLRLIERERQQHRHEIQTLLDRLADKNGRPWTPSPADMTRPDTDPTPPAWTASPEQDPLH